ncbi:hypothetical protein GE061_012328 [Apolygus lucorum]|uniref:Prostaglandin reductase 1 n=1 Tax=Apolygus lucorum TaxID=248454 RepID=A0A6A4JIS6_APOLU|nr:hypothetical protein GE061_012328 [Apolygus lucorum]
MKAKKFLLAKRPTGEPKVTDFEAVQEELPPVCDGEILLESVYLSVDPYMRYMSESLPLGSIMPSTVIARVVESKHANYKVGDNVIAAYGWRSHFVVDPEKPFSAIVGMKQTKLQILPDFGGVPTSLALGILGMPGVTALYGLTKLTQPEAGETLVVSGAAGAVGSIVGQIGKILDMNVIGFAGTDSKVEWLKELGFDYAYNYKKISIKEALKESAPCGVDVYFDNVGGQISYDVFSKMNTFGRVSLCGAISSYNDMGDTSKPPLAPAIQLPAIANQLSIHGFLVTRWLNEWQDGVKQLLGYFKKGKLKYRETITEGFDNMPQAFIDVLRGENTGKALVKANL